MISILPLACSLFVIITAVLRQVRQWHREEGEVHGDALGHTVLRWESVLGFQGERGHIDRVPPGKSLPLVGLGSYRAWRRGVGALEEGVGGEQGCPRVQIMSNLIKIKGRLSKLSALTLVFC